MAARWYPHRQEECVKEAELGAGQVDLLPPVGYLYRFDDKSYATCIDPDGDVWGSTTQVELTAYPIVKVTPCAYWVRLPYSTQNRLVYAGARKRFASKTIELAKESFIARKRKQAQIFRARADKADHAIYLLTGEMFPVPK